MQDPSTLIECLKQNRDEKTTKNKKSETTEAYKQSQQTSYLYIKMMCDFDDKRSL